jgi:hypothetical protein
MDKSINSKTIPESLVASVSVSVTDVRVGNLIYNDFGEIQPVYGVDEKSILTKAEENGWSICLKPKEIQLTEEWLIRFGFETGNYGRSYFLRYRISEENQEYSYISFWGFERASLDAVKINCKSVHQLQNLYFVLTGLELRLVV